MENELDALLATADRALAAATDADSADIWTEVFHHFFPMPKEDIVNNVNNNALTTLNFDPQIRVVAVAGKRQFTGMNRIGPIPRGCSLKFDLKNHLDLPAGAVVSWIVRNAGIEAEAKNDLGHINQKGVSAEERSAYKGDHNMDVTVHLNGRIIGRRRVPVTISGLGIAIRNPAKKPWVKLRSK